MDPFAEIRNRLAGRPGLRIEEKNGCIEAIPDDEGGFPVSLFDEGNHFTVGYGGWHEQFESVEDAVECFGFGLSERCRLKSFLAGSSEYKWTVEYLNDGAWTEDRTVGLIFYPYWRKRHIIYRQNGLTTKEPGGEWKLA
jgi:hypothetical protein